jgi:hypothetical protein
MFPSPSLVAPLLSPSPSPPLCCGIPLTGGVVVVVCVGAGGGVIVLVVVGAGGGGAAVVVVDVTATGACGWITTRLCALVWCAR